MNKITPDILNIEIVTWQIQHVPHPEVIPCITSKRKKYQEHTKSYNKAPKSLLTIPLCLISSSRNSKGVNQNAWIKPWTGQTSFSETNILLKHPKELHLIQSNPSTQHLNEKDYKTFAHFFRDRSVSKTAVHRCSRAYSGK